MNVPPKLQKALVLGAIAACVLVAVAFSPAEPALTVIIDAGHGGSDPGNLGTGRFKTTEKDITLKVALKLRDYIEERMPDVRIVMTRENDSYPTLKDRVKLANSTQADLFISIHCDAFTKPSALGSSTFVMGMHKNDEALRVAQQENSAIFREANHEEDYAGFDPNDPDTFIALALKQKVYQNASLDLAASIQDQFRTRVGRKDRGVKQAGYYVISFTQMPSVLVELGFLTNPTEEDYLNNSENQAYLASAIFRAFRDWKEKREARLGMGEAGDGNGVNRDGDGDGDGDGGSAVDVSSSGAGGTAGRTQSASEASGQSPLASEASLPFQSTSEASGPLYRVQVCASEEQISTDDPRFAGYPTVVEYLRGGLYKYAIGGTPDRAAAEALKNQLRAGPFPDAFVVEFEGDGPR
jgi:N-acetylmuramoyl-L-alanine amidase